MSFLSQLENLLGSRAEGAIYQCIRDLIEHGLDRSRFPPGSTTPNRQAVTEHLAAWSRHVGLSEEESRSWLVDYTVAMLGSISKSTPAAIRHSTKSNLRYIYRSEVPFVCRCAHNRFRAACRGDCPVYAEMHGKSDAEERPSRRPVLRPEAPLVPTVLPVKQLYREQLQTGLRLALEETQKGIKLHRIVEVLNERGLKTRTGRPWTYGILRNELQRLQKAPVPLSTDESPASTRPD
jgi:hypothetical protein